MPKTNIQTVKIASESEAPPEIEFIVEELIKVQQGMQALRNSRLKRHAILVLIKSKTSLPLNTIDVVLDTAEKLAHHFLK